jgi:tetratricopeptide (TPR) repeat protein
VRRWLVVLGCVLLTAAAALFIRRARRPAPRLIPVAVERIQPELDGGPSDDEVLAASLARLAEFKRQAEEAELAARARSDSGPSGSSAVAVFSAALDAGTDMEVSRELAGLAGQLHAGELEAVVERVHAVFRSHSPAAVPALLFVSKDLQRRARSGNAVAVEPLMARLRELPTSDPAVRAPLARLLGTLAVSSTQAAHYEDAKSEAHAALELEDTNAEAYLALGELQFQDNDLSGALGTWERGLRMNPDHAVLARRLERGRAEVARVGSLERVASEHFAVSFDGRTDVSGARASLDTMEAAYRQVGALFQLFPEGPIPLVLYPNRTFQQEGHAVWTAGVYDGKIRVPAEGASAHSLRYRGTLFHEYAHALFHRATRNLRTPTWLNEGFAEVAKLRAAPDARVGCLSGHAVPLASLDGGFQRLDSGSAHFAYLEARHAVERIIDRHGEEGVRALLNEVALQGDFRKGFARALGQEYETFAREFDAEARN